MKIKKIIKYTFFSCLALFIAVILIRVFMNADRSTLSEIAPTANARAAYKELGEKAFTTHDFLRDISADGYFTAYGLSYCQSKKEVQITIRYNDSLPERYLPGTLPEDYYFKLCDKEGNILAKSTTEKTKERYFYNYMRIAFENVEIQPDSEIYLYLCADGSDYPKDITEGFMVHAPGQEFESLDLSDEEAEELKK